MSFSWLNRSLAFIRGGERQAQLVRGFLGVGGLKMISIPLALLASIVLARLLGPEGYGQYSFIIAVIIVLSTPLGPALMMLTTRETARLDQRHHGRSIRTLLRWANGKTYLVSTIVIVALGSIAVSLAAWRVDDAWTLILLPLLSLPFLGLNAVRSGVLSGLRKVVLGQLPELIVRPMTLLLISTLLFIAGFLNVFTALIAYVAATFIAFVLGAVLLKRNLPKEPESEPVICAAQKRYWLRSWPSFTLLVGASVLNAQIGILLLGWLSEGDQVAALQVADRGAMLVTVSLTVVNLVIGPHITRTHWSGDLKRLQTLSRYSARLALAVALPIGLPLIFFGSVILGFVFGPEYADIATVPLAILATAQLFNVAFGSVGLLLIMTGYENDPLWTQGISLIITSITAVILVPEYSATGAAIAVASGIVFSNILQAVIVFYRLRIVPTVF